MPSKYFSPTVFLFVLIFISLQFAALSGTHISVKGQFLLGYELGNDFPSDWLGCIEACHKNTQCISYNFNLRYNVCQLNRGGIRASFVADRTLNADENYIFHQLKIPQDHQQATPRYPKCRCNCDSARSCYTKKWTPGLGDIADKPAPSCREILSERRDAKNGPYYLATFPTTSYVYCHMTELPGCGGGGWTLVMKMDGSKPTFRYNSSLWTNETPYELQNGRDLEDTETALPTYWNMKISRICLGMKAKGVTRWISLNHTATTLMKVLDPETPVYTNLDVVTWKGLLSNSSLQTHCTRQGFNMKDEAQARIGIIGFRTGNCTSLTSASRLGFGTAGSLYGMNDANSCGNEARSNSDNKDKSIMAFGYILVQ